MNSREREALQGGSPQAQRQELCSSQPPVSPTRHQRYHRPFKRSANPKSNSPFPSYHLL